jgi:trans-2,3-dihydro-3-hydroxyanthranilate isomerase
MTTSVPFYLVDVFAERPLAGNPLALVTRAERLNERAMKLVAREFNQSETTFLLPPTRPEATWRLRSFTPSGSEVVGAGHNALGAWWWLADHGQLTLSHGAGTFAQELGGRVLPVEVVAGDGARPASIFMDQSPPSFGATVSKLAALAAALGLTAADLDRDLPAQVVDTGAAHLLVAVADRGAVDRAAPNPSTLLAELEAVGAQGCYLYSRDPNGEDVVAYARFFNPTVGIWEDPATGSAAGPLASLLVTRASYPTIRPWRSSRATRSGGRACSGSPSAASRSGWVAPGSWSLRARCGSNRGMTRAIRTRRWPAHRARTPRKECIATGRRDGADRGLPTEDPAWSMLGQLRDQKGRTAAGFRQMVRTRLLSTPSVAAGSGHPCRSGTRKPRCSAASEALCRTRTGDPFLTINARGNAGCCMLLRMSCKRPVWTLAW